MPVTYNVVKSTYQRGTPSYWDKIKVAAKSQGAQSVFLLFSGSGASIIDVRSMNSVWNFKGKNLKNALPLSIKEYERVSARRHSTRVIVVPDYLYGGIVEGMKHLPDMYIHGSRLDIIVNAPDYIAPTSLKLKSSSGTQIPENVHPSVQGIDGVVTQIANGTQTFAELVENAAKPTDISAAVEEFEKALKNN